MTTNKIALDCRLVSRNATGISRFSLKYTDFIIEKFGEKNIVLIVNEPIQGYEHIEQCLTDFKPFNFYHWLRFHKLVAKLKPTHYISFHYSGLSKKLSNIKTVVTVHDLMYELVPTFFGSKFISFLGRLYYRPIVSRSLKNSDLILTISETSKKDIKSIFNLDSVNTSEGVFLNAPEVESFLDSIGLVSKSYFLYAGNGRPHKNIEQLKRVFLKYRQSNQEACLVIVGHKGDSQGGIVYPGHVSDGELVNLYTNAKAFVFPSLYEGFGLPIVESLNYNTPVIASDIPAFREFQHNNIYYFDLNNDESLLRLLGSELSFDHATKHNILKQYDWDVIKQKLYKALEGLF
ncbi:glycosyltransferase family 4 protein [Catenovulum sediminis]|uniref:glycosyltransferase family 4 protein n=1 Tax=Catenovulum sediminis TaxID=1740262 RepID=UPI00117C570A|nr:glycosyltransferase family 1 protein [Catenovulum sediminis]